MGKSLLFYVIDEYTDEIKYCKRRGLLPHKFEDKICYCSDPSIGDEIIKSVVQYSGKGYIYDVLEINQCYSGYTSTLMRLPKLSYEELLNVALYSKNWQERAGATGMILKDHPVEFEQYLSSIKKIDVGNSAEIKSIKRIVTLIYDFIRENTSYVRPLEKIMNLCEELKLQLE